MKKRNNKKPAAIISAAIALAIAFGYFQFFGGGLDMVLGKPSQQNPAQQNRGQSSPDQTVQVQQGTQGKHNSTASLSGVKSGDCTSSFPAGIPVAENQSISQTINKSLIPLCYSYASYYYPGTKTSLFVAEKLVPGQMSGDSERQDDFRPNPSLPASQSAQLSDYKGMNAAIKKQNPSMRFDRGHLAPAADYTYSNAAMSETFFLSNMVPQVSSHNQGIWRDLEIKVRNKVRYDKATLYVITGPVYDQGKAIFDYNGLKAPTHLYKIIADPSTKKTQAYVIANLPFKGAGKGRYSYGSDVYELNSFIMPVKTLSKMTGINFFPQGGYDTASSTQILK